MLMRKITLFLIAVAALAFAAHAGQLSASPGTTTSVEPAIANSLSDLGTQDEPTEQTEPPMFNGLTEDGVQGFGVIIFDTEPDCTIYYRYVFEGEGYSEWMEYTEMLWFTEPGHYRVEAYAVAPGKDPSEVYAYEFMVVELQTLCPIITITTGNSYQGTYVDITESEPDCYIYFRYQTADGYWSDWMAYTDAMTFTEPGDYVIEAYAVAPGKAQSEVVAEWFTVSMPEQTEAPMFNGFTEDGVQGFGVIIFDTEPDCTIYYRYVFEGEGYSEWMEYTDELWFTEPGHYRVEAYAVAMGKTVSEVYAYEFIVMPIVQPGDLNHDGILGIEDVTTLIDIIISNSTTTPECDVNQDGSVDIADVTDLIDYILAQ